MKQVKDGKTKHPLYWRWNAMKERCKSSPDYFGRGIKVCDRWMDFWSFVQDMGPCPEGFQLDRIDNDGNYEPVNCRWTHPSMNSKNRRNRSDRQSAEPYISYNKGWQITYRFKTELEAIAALRKLELC